ncbi:MAG: SRPBCC family protein [Gaiella sp.]
MGSVAETFALTRELTIAARPETVWQLLVDGRQAGRWMGVEAQLEPTPGGLYRVEVIPGHVARGTFVEVDPPRRLVFTWGWEPQRDGTQALVTPGSSTVEFVLEPHGEGTRVLFTHRDLPSTEAVESHAVGWDHYLPRLVAAGSGAEPGSDEWAERAES